MSLQKLLRMRAPPCLQGSRLRGGEMLVASQEVDAGEMFMEEETYTGAGAKGKQPEGVVYNSSKGVMYPAALQRLLEGGL